MMPQRIPQFLHPKPSIKNQHLSDNILYETETTLILHTKILLLNYNQALLQFQIYYWVYQVAQSSLANPVPNQGIMSQQRNLGFFTANIFDYLIYFFGFVLVTLVANCEIWWSLLLRYKNKLSKWGTQNQNIGFLSTLNDLAFLCIHQKRAWYQLLLSHNITSAVLID